MMKMEINAQKKNENVIAYEFKSEKLKSMEIDIVLSTKIIVIKVKVIR